jgi:hypothetical protein
MEVETERAPRRVLAGFAALAVLMVVFTVGLARLVGQPAGEERVVVIPRGTAERIAAGERVELLPADLRFRLRDTLVVVNDDDTTHQVGPFTVAAGQRLEKRFSEAATLEGSCSLHPSGSITIEITDR